MSFAIKKRSESMFLIIVLLTLFIIIGCSSDESITEVTQPGELYEKKVTNDSNEKEKFEATFSTLNINHIPKNITFEINKNVWNLLENDKVYELHFIYKHQSDNFVLEEISLSQVSLDNFRQKVKEIKGKIE
ncbi:hypothetical protein [Thalassobacillus pellis]|uniref:hypothetical protein n=1 Tax=Thalassobacillus pellis TaxID=748008 RepID=UPI001961E0E8|nr:hypothetical protein [Thalassobacillus pellis]MBM7553949.1 uncharacterized protein YcfL [Thalassobacillus pellis]